MWKKLKTWASGKPQAAPEPRARRQYSGTAIVAVEMDEKAVSADTLHQAFCAEVIGVRSFLDTGNALETTTMRRVDRMLKRGGDFSALVPRVPAVIPRLFRSLRDESVSGKQLAAEVSQDVTLVAELIRLANSPFYRTREAINSVEQATVLLGRDGMRNLISKAAFKPLLNASKDYFTGQAAPILWAHADKSSMLCECLAKREGAPVFPAYLAGLIHNIGYSIVVRVLGQEYDGKEVPRSVMFRDWLVKTAPVLSRVVAVEWGFPQEVTDALDDIAKAREGARLSPLGAVAASASTLAALQVLSEAGVVTGDITRVACRVDGRHADSCLSCYSLVADAARAL